MLLPVSGAGLFRFLCGKTIPDGLGCPIDDSSGAICSMTERRRIRMPRKKKPNDYGTGIPSHEVEALARVLLPEIQKFFESEDGQREFAE